MVRKLGHCAVKAAWRINLQSVYRSLGHDLLPLLYLFPVSSTPPVSLCVCVCVCLSLHLVAVQCLWQIKAEGPCLMDAPLPAAITQVCAALNQHLSTKVGGVEISRCYVCWSPDDRCFTLLMGWLPGLEIFLSFQVPAWKDERKTTCNS